MDTSVALWAGVLVGSVLLLGVVWVWVQKQIFGMGGGVMTGAGVLLIGLLVFQSFAFEVGGFRLEALMKETRTTQALLLEQQGKLDEAEVVFREITETDPEDPRALEGLAGVLQKQGKLEEATETYRRSLEINPDNLNARAELGRVLLETGDRQEARENLEAVLEAKPAQPTATQFLTRLHMEEGRPEQAEEVVKQAEREAPRNIKAWQGISRAYSDLGNQAAAEKAIKEGLQIAPEDPELKADLNQLRADQRAAARRENQP